MQFFFLLRCLHIHWASPHPQTQYRILQGTPIPSIYGSSSATHQLYRFSFDLWTNPYNWEMSECPYISMLQSEVRSEIKRGMTKLVCRWWRFTNPRGWSSLSYSVLGLWMGWCPMSVATLKKNDRSHLLEYPGRWSCFTCLMQQFVWADQSNNRHFWMRYWGLNNTLLQTYRYLVLENIPVPVR